MPRLACFACLVVYGLGLPALRPWPLPRMCRWRQGLSTPVLARVTLSAASVPALVRTGLAGLDGAPTPRQTSLAWSDAVYGSNMRAGVCGAGVYIGRAAR